MLTWNYRIVQKDNGYSIYNVYYNRVGSIVAWYDSPTPRGATPTELKNDLRKMADASQRYVLTERDLKTLATYRRNHRRLPRQCRNWGMLPGPGTSFSPFGRESELDRLTEEDAEMFDDPFERWAWSVEVE